MGPILENASDSPNEKPILVNCTEEADVGDKLDPSRKRLLITPKAHSEPSKKAKKNLDSLEQDNDATSVDKAAAGVIQPRRSS